MAFIRPNILLGFRAGVHGPFMAGAGLRFGPKVSKAPLQTGTHFLSVNADPTLKHIEEGETHLPPLPQDAEIIHISSLSISPEAVDEDIYVSFPDDFDAHWLMKPEGPIRSQNFAVEGARREDPFVARALSLDELTGQFHRMLSELEIKDPVLGAVSVLNWLTHGDSRAGHDVLERLMATIHSEDDINQWGSFFRAGLGLTPLCVWLGGREAMSTLLELGSVDGFDALAAMSRLSWKKGWFLEYLGGLDQGDIERSRNVVGLVHSLRAEGVPILDLFVDLFQTGQFSHGKLEDFTGIEIRDVLYHAAGVESVDELADQFQQYWLMHLRDFDRQFAETLSDTQQKLEHPEGVDEADLADAREALRWLELWHRGKLAEIDQAMATAQQELLQAEASIREIIYVMQEFHRRNNPDGNYLSHDLQQQLDSLLALREQRYFQFTEIRLRLDLLSQAYANLIHPRVTENDNIEIPDVPEPARFEFVPPRDGAFEILGGDIFKRMGRSGPIIELYSRVTTADELAAQFRQDLDLSKANANTPVAIHLALPNVRHIVAVVTPFQARSVSFLENLLNTNYEFTKRAFVIIDCGPITEGEESRLRLFYFQVPKTASLKDAETLFFYFTRFLAKYNPGALLEARALKFLPHVFEKYLEDVCRFEREDQLWVEGRLPGLGSTSGEGSENDDPGFSDEGDDGDPYSNFAPFASRTLFGGAVGLEGVSSGSGNTWFLGANENDTKPDARAPDFDDETNPRARRPEQRDPKTLTPKVEESEGRTPPSGRPTPLTTTGSGEGEVTLRVMTDCRLQLHHKGHVYVLTQKYDNESGVVYRFDPLGEGDNYRLIKASSPIGQMVARLEKEGQIIF